MTRGGQPPDVIAQVVYVVFVMAVINVKMTQSGMQEQSTTKKVGRVGRDRKRGESAFSAQLPVQKTFHPL